MAIKPVAGESLAGATSWIRHHFFQPIEYISAGGFASSASSSVSLSVPAGAQTGDLLVAVFVVRDACDTLTGFSWSGEWSSLGSTELGDMPVSFGLYGAYVNTRMKFHDGSESSLTVGYTASGSPTMCCGRMFAFRGAHETLNPGSYDSGGIPNGMTDASPLNTGLTGPELKKRSSNLMIIFRGKSSTVDGGLVHNSTGYVSSYDDCDTFSSTLAGEDGSLFVYLGANATGKTSDVTDSSGHTMTYTGVSSSFTYLSIELKHADYIDETPPM
jgi:hypothetical protein